jgi:hypothetical protein
MGLMRRPVLMGVGMLPLGVLLISGMIILRGQLTMGMRVAVIMTVNEGFLGHGHQSCCS